MQQVGLQSATPPTPPESVVHPACLDAGRSRPRRTLRIHDVVHALGERTWLMGILNATPDSFSDGGSFPSMDAAVAHALGLWEAGADIVDVGGESTRPGAGRVDVVEERRRVIPVIAGLRRLSDVLISVDTTRREVAEAALDAGADIVNDISGLRFDPALGALVARRGSGLILMHSRGDFAGLHESPRYADVMGEVVAELGAMVRQAQDAGVAPAQLLIDPGIGFSKNARHSLAVLRHLAQIHALGLPVVVGPSRKSFIGHVLGAPVHERLLGTAASVAAAILRGAHVIRVHDVAAMRSVARMCDALTGETC
jgi:dihydropteroate synthase